MIDRKLVVVVLVLLTLSSALFYVGNDIKNDELSRIKKKTICTKVWLKC